MPIIKQTIVGMISILMDGQLQIREDTVVLEDGLELARTFHRRILAPGESTDSETDKRVIDISAIIWTPEIIKAYQEKLKATTAIGTSAIGVLTNAK